MIERSLARRSAAGEISANGNGRQSARWRIGAEGAAILQARLIHHVVVNDLRVAQLDGVLRGARTNRLRGQIGGEDVSGLRVVIELISERERVGLSKLQIDAGRNIDVVVRIGLRARALSRCAGIHAKPEVAVGCECGLKIVYLFVMVIALLKIG